MIPTSEWIVTGLLRASVGLSIAALSVAACVRLLRLRAPQAEQWAWLFVLAQGVMLLPVSIPVPPGLWGPGVAWQRRPTAEVFPRKSPRSTADSGSATTLRDVGHEPVPIRASTPEPQPGTTSAAAVRTPGEFRPAWSVVALTAWLGGIVALLGLGLVRYRSFAGLLCAARPAAPGWQLEWRRVLDEQAIRTPIPLVVGRDVGPALCRLPSGYRLVVPGSLWEELTPGERATILRHELAHFRRGDLWATLLARTLATVQWFNPLAWWAASRFEAQAEFLCDRASAPDDPAAFAETLLRLGSGHHGRVAIAQSARAGSLFERIQRLLGDSSRPARWKCALPVAVAILAFGTSAVRLQAVAMPDAAEEEVNRATDTAGTKTPLPPRALLRIGTDDLRTREFITGVAFSGDGKLVAAAEANNPVPRVSIFDVRTGRQVKLLISQDRPAGWVKCVDFSPDGTKLVWGEIGGHVALWDLTHDRMRLREQLHAHAVNQVAFSPDGSVMASAGEDGVVHLRLVGNPTEVVQDLATGERQPVHRGFRGRPPGPPPVGPIYLAFTPDGTRLVVGSGSGATISIWRIKDGRLLRRIERAHGNSRGSSNPSVTYVAVTPDGRRIMSAGERTEPIEQTKLKYGARNVRLSEVRFWDIETGERMTDLHDEEDHGFGYAALSRDGHRVAVGDFSLLRILDSETGQPERTIALPGWWGSEPAFSPDGTIVAVPIDNTIGLFDVRTGRRLHHDERMPVGGVRSAAWSPSGDRIVTGHADGIVRVWEAESGKLLWHKLLAPVISRSGWNANPAFVAFSRDGRRIVAAGRRDDPVEYRDGIVAIFEAGRGLRVREVFQKEIRHAALSPDRRIVVVATSNGSADDTHLLGIEMDTGRTLWATPPEAQRAGLDSTKAIQFRPDSASLKVALRNGDVIHFDALTGNEQRRFLADWRSPEQRKAGRPREPDLWDGVFSTDGRTLVSSSNEWVYVWDVDTSKLRRTIRHPHRHGCYLALAPDGKTLATSNTPYAGDFGDDTIRLYDLKSGDQVLTLEARDDRAEVLTFSPDGTKLFTGFQRGSAIVWDVRRGEGVAGGK